MQPLPQPSRRSPLGVLFLTVFIDLLGFGIVIPLLQLYAKRFDASPLSVGALVAVYSAMQLLFAPIWGGLSDRIGRRPVMLVSIFGTAVAHLLCALAGSIEMLLAARTLAGVCGANIATAQAYVADVTTPENRTRGMGLIGAAFGIGFVIGPALAGVVARYAGHRAPFWVAGGLSALNLALAAVLLPETRTGPASPRRPRIASLKMALGSPSLAKVMLVFFIATFAFANLESTFSMWLAEPPFRYDEERVGYLFAFIGVILAIVQGGLTGRLARRLGELRLVQTGTASIALGMLLLPVAATRAALLSVVALIASGNGLNNPAITATLSKSAPPDQQGEVLGVAQSIAALARILGPLVGGYLFGRLGRHAPYWVGGLAMACASLLALRLGKARAS